MIDAASAAPQCVRIRIRALQTLLFPRSCELFLFLPFPLIQSPSSSYSPPFLLLPPSSSSFSLFLISLLLLLIPFLFLLLFHFLLILFLLLLFLLLCVVLLLSLHLGHRTGVTPAATGKEGGKVNGRRGRGSGEGGGRLESEGQGDCMKAFIALCIAAAKKRGCVIRRKYLVSSLFWTVYACPSSSPTPFSSFPIFLYFLHLCMHL